ncbi:MAG TPA: ankyrin repeat domain-containing protein [Candidatus Tumulicola sp.]|jgi:hypothetical protein
MPTRLLPQSPNLDHLKSQARELLRDHKTPSLQVLQRVREFHPRFHGVGDDAIAASGFRLSDAQLTIAREYGFLSWPRLKAFVEHPNGDDVRRAVHLRVTDPLFRKAIDLMDAGDADNLRALLREHPQLAAQHTLIEGMNYFRTPGLIEFVAENPTRNGRLPANIVEIAQIVIDAGAKNDRRGLDDAVALVASSEVAQKSGNQMALIRVLCAAGAEPNQAVLAPMLYAQFDAVEELLRCGATMNVAIAAATGRSAEAKATLPAATQDQRLLALAFAAQFGHLDIVEQLIEAGVDPNRFTPHGHSHATPLHQTALNNRVDIARYLVDHGARTDIADVLHRSTPLGWARYAGNTEIAEYLAQIDDRER